ncbi:AAA family ATPase [Candidatus Ventrimonas sp. KK005]
MGIKGRFEDSEKGSVRLLSNGSSGISESLAKEIVEILGEDLFSCPDRKGLKEQLLSIPGIGEKKAMLILQRIKAGRNQDEVFRFLSDYGVPYSAVLSYMAKEGGSCVKELRKNPYPLMAYGVPFDLCDTIAMKNHLEPWDLKRIHAIMEMVLGRMKSRGDTRMEYEKFLKEVSGYSFKNGKSTIIVPQILVEILLYSIEDVKVYKDGEKQYVTPLDLFFQERDIVKSVQRLNASGRKIVYDLQAATTKLEKEDGLSFCDEQREAFGILEHGGVEILLGGPGTGKTTTINGIVKAYLHENPDKKVLLCAPTGMGAVRMGEISGQLAFTIHRAMKVKWLGGGKAEPEPLPYELIVADEMSMCDTELFSLFLRSAASGTSILIAGDYNQIPSVGPGQILRDLAESGMCKIYRLTQVFRQKEGSLIAENAGEILKGGTLSTGKEFRITTVADDSELIRKLGNMEFDEFSQVLSPVKKGVSGTLALNTMIQEKRNWKDDGIWINGNWFHIGDRIMMNANNYEKGYRNGEIGRIKDIQDLTIRIGFVDRDLCLHMLEAGEMSLAYALTFHKSQGAECDSVLIILPSGAEPMASRELLYTAVTRARKSVHICAVKEVLQAFVNAEGKCHRECGLRSRFRGRIGY